MKPIRRRESIKGNAVSRQNLARNRQIIVHIVGVIARNQGRQRLPREPQANGEGKRQRRPHAPAQRAAPARDLPHLYCTSNSVTGCPTASRVAASGIKPLTLARPSYKACKVAGLSNCSTR